MKKQSALALSAALALFGTGAAHAGYYSYLENFTGSFDVSGFADADPDTFTITLTNLSGVVDITLPPDGVWSAARTGFIGVDYTPANPGYDLVSNSSSWIPLGTATVSTGGITGSHFVFDFDTGSFTSDGVSYTNGSFTASASTLNLLLGSMFGPLGAAIGTGSVSVSHTLTADTWTIDITETDVGGTGFSGLFATLDSTAYGGNNDGQIDGTFLANAAVHVPEPMSVALLGLGLAGLACSRRRKAS